MTKMWTLVALLGSLAAAVPADAQRRDDDKKDREQERKEAEIPKAFRPPPGMCRIWLDDVPPGQQPAPTECKTALRNKPAKARVIFGDDYVDKDRKREPTLKEFKAKDDGRKDATKRAPWRRP